MASAIALSDREQNHAVTPGEPRYGLSLDEVIAIGRGEPGSSSLAEIIVFQCSGALIGDLAVGIVDQSDLDAV